MRPPTPENEQCEEKTMVEIGNHLSMHPREKTKNTLDLIRGDNDELMMLPIMCEHWDPT